MDLSIILPAHNETKRIAPCLINCLHYALNHPLMECEVIVVANGCTDDTRAEVELGARFYKTSPKINKVPLRLYEIQERSKALAVQKGVMKAKGDYLYIADVDLSTPLEEIYRFLDGMEHAQVVIGSRRVPGAFVRQSKRRAWMTWLFHLLAAPLVPNIQDTQCGFKMFERETAVQLFSTLTTTSLAYDVEILAKAERDCTILEIPVIWKENPDSRVRLVRDTLSMAADVIRMMFESLHWERRLYAKAQAKTQNSKAAL